MNNLFLDFELDLENVFFSGIWWEKESESAIKRSIRLKIDYSSFWLQKLIFSAEYSQIGVMHWPRVQVTEDECIEIPIKLNTVAKISEGKFYLNDDTGCFSDFVLL